jgi:NAD(P)H-hydrate repair Nnr-like enzyme with NAD(P)H-hydrate dehydratase domain
MNWLRQKGDEAVFPDLVWSRPVNKRYAGKLLIIGGHGQSFSAVSAAYSAALAAGIGTARVIVPDSLQKTLSAVFPEAEYAPSTPIGSFSRKALAELVDASDWADGLLLAGDFGRNSETAVLLENFIAKYRGILIITGDTLDYFLNEPAVLTERDNTVLVGSIKQLQKLASPHLIEQRAELIKSVEQISVWAQSAPISVVTSHAGQVIVAHQDQISTTPARITDPDVQMAAYANVWRLQQPEKPFEALTTAVYCCL